MLFVKTVLNIQNLINFKIVINQEEKIMLLKTIKRCCYGASSNIWIKFIFKFVILSSVCYAASIFAAGDELADVMTSAKSNFGAGSTFIKLMYGAEIIAGGYAWHKTKHPSAVIGIVVLALFMTFALNHWVFV